MNLLAPTMEAPSGTVALVFTDIQGSTLLWERCSTAMRTALELHDRILRTLLASSGGYEVKTQGDSFMVAFPSALEAVRWCLEVQEVLLSAPWPPELLEEPEAAEVIGPHGLLYRGLRVRMGVHVGEPELRINTRTGQVDYIGRMVNVAARVAEAGHGGQVLLSGMAWAQVAGMVDRLGRPAVRVLGSFRLKGIGDPLPLLEVLPPSLADRRFESLRVQEARRGNLPEEPGDIIGREEELECLRLWLVEGCRLITILGPGGMGKTRLATHFGGLQMGSRQWEGGVWWCDLTEAKTLEGFCHAVGQALGVQLTSGGAEEAPVDLLGRALGGRGAALVILDNLEHLTQLMPATLRRWLAMAPQVRFLVTSQESLRMAGERILDLAPMGLPDYRDTSLEAVSRSDAVRLFVRRAQAARGSFELTAADAPLVADIVRRLDGIALAIELAAARTALLGIRQLRERLSRRFELLNSGMRDAVARQATLRGAIDWSWSLLDMTEQVVLAQCSVFRGGFTLEAAEAVIALPHGGPDVLEVVQALRSKSLLRSDAAEGLSGELRLSMYESIREYASARLDETGLGAELVSRHAEYYLSLARELRGPAKGGGVEALRRLTLERENLLSVCDYAFKEGSPTLESVQRALEALVLLEPDVITRGPLGLTLSRLDKALEQAATLSGEWLLSAEALAVRGRIYLETGQIEAARRDLEAARKPFQQLGEVAREKRLLVDLSIVARHEGDVASAWELIQEALQLPSGGDRWLDAYALGNLGITEQVRSGPEAAITHLHEALKLFQLVGDAAFEVLFLNNLASAIGESGRTMQAVGFLEEAFAKALGSGSRAGQAFARLNLGCYLLEADQPTEAIQHLEAVVELGRQLGLRIVEGCARGELGRACLNVGETENARAHLLNATSLLTGVSRWHALRFSLHLAAVQAAQGQLLEARRGFAALGGTQEIRNDPVLRELAGLLFATVALAELRAVPGGGLEAEQRRADIQQRLDRARLVPPEGASSDLRGWWRLLDRELGMDGPTLEVPSTPLV
ncbi:ATP-binding protein [Stigmatella aurantiaca]|nr:adenylate/guanylate cyclase domain-containing protein [Stigmatella aurantiaca]